MKYGTKIHALWKLMAVLGFSNKDIMTAFKVAKRITGRAWA